MKDSHMKILKIISLIFMIVFLILAILWFGMSVYTIHPFYIVTGAIGSSGLYRVCIECQKDFEETNK